MVSLDKEKLLADLKERVEKQLKISFPEYLKQTQKTEGDIRNSFSELARKRVKNFLILREIGRKENIEVKEEEVEKAVNEFLKRYPDVETTKREVDLKQLREYYRGVIYNEKVFEKLENFSE